MPTDYGDFDLHMYRSVLDGVHHLALVKGTLSKARTTLVRVHSECLTGDVFGSRRCDCGTQLQAALQMIDRLDTASCSTCASTKGAASVCPRRSTPTSSRK